MRGADRQPSGGGGMGVILLRHTKPDAPEGLCYGRLDLAPAMGFAAQAAAIAQDLPPIGGLSPRRCSAARAGQAIAPRAACP